MATSMPFKVPHIYETLEEPVLLREMLVDDIYLFAGQYAILCQWAHPALAKGSHARSNFAKRILNRLVTTARFLNVAVYGNTEEKEAIFSVIHKYHAPIVGEGYDANDPELHKWTAATLFVAFAVVHELVFGKLSKDQMETLFRESAVYGTSLRMPPEMWPASLDEFWEYWNHNIETLEVTNEARELAAALLYPTNLPLSFSMLAPVSRFVTSHILPERLAKEYELQSTAMSRMVFDCGIGTFSMVYPRLPESVRCRMHNQAISDMKRAVTRINKTGHWVPTQSTQTQNT